MASKEAQWKKLQADLKNYRVGSCVGGVQVRLEVNDLAQNELQFNLFLLSLDALMNEVTTDGQFPLRKKDIAKDYLSFFHIAGIHGCPAVDWGDVPQNWWFKYLNQRSTLVPDWWNPEHADFAGDKNNPIFKVGNPSGGYVAFSIARHVADCTPQATALWYCVHGSPQFLIWHRPYLALIEQMIGITAKFFADQVTEPTAKRRWQEAAEQLRFPYWDFCRPNEGDYNNPSTLRYGFPDPMRLKYVRVLRPNAAAYVNIKNPLYSFTYPTDAKLRTALTEIPPARGSQTTAADGLIRFIRRSSPIIAANPDAPAYSTRWPTGVPAQSQNNVLQAKASQTVDVQRMRIYYTLTKQQNFPQLSTSAPIRLLEVQNRDIVGDYTASLENIHDDYHASGLLLLHRNIAKCLLNVKQVIGGTSAANNATEDHTGVTLGQAGVIPFGGTLTAPETAGFEPGFWMMHGFYEYTTCLWQLIHNRDQDWWGDLKYKRIADNVAWMRKDSLEGPDTPLLPFKKPPGKRDRTDPHKFWTPKSARDWLQFGYTYPDMPLAPLTSMTAAEKTSWADRATFRVNMLYGWMYPASPNAAATRGTFLAGPMGQAMFAAKTDGTTAWVPSTVVPDAVRLANKQPIHNFSNLAWYPRMRAGFNPATDLNDTTDIANLDVGPFIALTPPPPVVPPPVVRAMAGKSVSASARDGPRAAMSGFKLDPQLRAGFPSDAKGDERKAVPANIAPQAMAMAAPPPQSVPQATKLPAQGSEITPAPQAAVPPEQDGKSPAAPPKEIVPVRPLIPVTSCADKKGDDRHWDLHYEVDRFALNGTFFIHIFIGDFTPNHLRWREDPNHIHSSCIWVRSLTDEEGNDTNCANCQQLAADKTRYGDWVPLTLKLASYIASGDVGAPGTKLTLKSMDPSEVVPFLTRNLHWRVVDVDGKQFAREDTPGLKVWVTSHTVKMPEKPTDLPIWGEFEEHIDITDGRPSGVCHADIGGHVH